PEERFQGVGCETCHGPAASHVRAVTSGSETVKPKRLSEAKTEEVIELCGRCHRSTSVAADPGSPEMTNRFQGYGLKLSRCYNESGGGISCSFCHDPHSDAATDSTFYDGQCLKCHGEAAAKGAGSGKPCPVAPQAGCIRCHMPSLPVFATASLPIKMADHY